MQQTDLTAIDVRSRLEAESGELEEYRTALLQRRSQLDAERVAQDELAAALETRRSALRKSTAELEHLEAQLAARGDAYNKQRASLAAEIDTFRAQKLDMFDNCRSELEDYRQTLERRRGELEVQYRSLSDARHRLVNIHETLRGYAHQTATTLQMLDQSRLELPAARTEHSGHPAALGTGI